MFSLAGSLSLVYLGARLRELPRGDFVSRESPRKGVFLPDAERPPASKMDEPHCVLMRFAFFFLTAALSSFIS